jgi:endonuclease YncB( thermonuclease family)
MYPLDLSEANTPWLSFDKQIIKCKVVDIYDGDTITVILPLNGKMFKKKCRLFGIDCAEIRTKNLEEKSCGYDAKKFLHSHINDKEIWIECGNWDKYGRLLITIFLFKKDVGHFEKSINKLMIDSNHAYIYDGTKKQEFDKWHK